MLISKKIKWLSFHYLVLLYFSKKAFGDDPPALPTCDDDVADSSSDYCTRLTESAGFCIKENKNIYELKAGSCESIKTTSINQFSVGGATTTITDTVSGLLYYCKSENPGTDISTCKQITSGYYLEDATPDPKVLYHCEDSVCLKITSPGEGYYIASNIDEANKLYSYLSDTLNVVANAVVNEGYYVSGEDYDTDHYNKLIYCDGDGDCSTKIDPKKSSYYVSGADYATDHYTKLISCDEDSQCSEAAAVKVKGFYTNGVEKSDTDIKKLINCSSAVNSCIVVEEPNNGYYICGDGLAANGKPTTLFKCTDKSCTVETPEREGYYLDASSLTSTKYGNLIQCEHNASNKCEFSDAGLATNVTNNGDYYYLDGNDESKVIYCSKATNMDCKEIEGEVKPGYGYVDNGTEDNVIACTGGTCNSLVNGNANTIDSVAHNTGFLDASKGDNASKNIIICTSASCTSTPITASSSQGHAFLDGTSYDSETQKYSKVITCTSGICTPIETIPTYSTAEVYIDAGSIDGTQYKNIIKPVVSGTSTTFSVVAAVLTLPTAYIDATDKKKIILCNDGTVACKSDTNGASTATAFYINGLDTSEIIVCESTTSECTKRVGSETASKTKYYADIITTATKNIITCQTNAATPPVNTCSSAAHAGTTQSKNVYYIDGYTNGVLKCPQTGICSLLSTITTDEGTGYINADTKTVIQCSPTSGSKRDGNSVNCTLSDEVTVANKNYYYINATDKKDVIKCNLDSVSKCDSVGTVIVLDGTAYISTDSKKVIQCRKDSSGNAQDCTYTDGATTVKPKVHYINAETSTEIITCTNGNNCAKETTVVKADGYAYMDYIKEGNVIICPSSGSCTSDASKAAAAVTSGTAKPAQNVGYIDAADSTSKTLIVCKDTGTTATANKNCTSTAMESFPDGHVYLDGTSENSGTYKRLLNWDTSGSTSKIAVVGTNQLSTKGFAYFDGSDDTKKRIIKCTSTSSCEVVENASKAASGTTPATNAFYINGITDSKIIACEPGKECTTLAGCEEDDKTKYYPDSQVPANIIECKGATSSTPAKCQSIVHKATDGYYIDGYKEGSILSCDTTKGCAPLSTVNSDPGTGYINFDKKTVIQCSKSVSKGKRAKSKNTTETKTETIVTCNTLDAATGSTVLYYIDATSIDKIVTCKAAGCDNTTTATTTDLAMAYINPNATNIIQCTKNTTISCTYKEGSSTSVPLVHYIDAPTTKKIITCKTSGSKSSCESVNGVKDDGYAYIDYVNVGNVITCPSNVCSSNASKAVAATKQLPVQNANYINGYDTTKKSVITCVNTSSVNCTSTSLKTLPDGQVFLEGTTYNSGYVKLIKWDTTKDYLVVDDPKKTSTEGFAYIDGSDANLKRIITYESNKYVAKDNGAVEDFNKYYITGVNTTNIITCTKDGCSSGTGSTTKGQAYIEGIDTKKVITCETTGCKSSTGLDSSKSLDSYINAHDISQVINCNAKNCTLFDTNVKDNNALYYPRYVGGAKALLNCTKSSGSVGCKLTETVAANHQNNVFINSFDGKDGYDQESVQLIICDASALCKPTKIEIADDTPKFYPNSDPVNTEPLKNDLIKCVTNEEKDDAVECGITSGKKNDVYLNNNFATSKKQLLICLEEEGCTETQVNSTSPDYYINSGNVSVNKLEDTLIKCTSQTKECTIEETNDSEIYINSLDTSQTIQCYTDKGCTSIPSKATSTKNEIFLNSSDLNTEGQTVLKNDLIKCEMDEDDEITCKSADGIANEVYINSHNTTEIIFCTSEGCTSKPSEAETSKPEFYINADPTDETPLNGDLIKCKNNGSKITCEVFNGKDGDIFLNANVDNDSDGNPLIVCTEDGCQTDASNAEEESLPAYYVNSGSVLTAKLNDTLIQCTYDESALCSIIVAEANDVYVNYANNTETYPLIKCTNNGCKTSLSGATENSKEYYLNAGDTGEKALDFDIIECTNEDNSISCIELENTGVGVYLNSNYAESGDKNQLIQCRSDSGCEGIRVGDKSVEYYVNAEAENLTNAIIYCSNKKCEKQSPEKVPTYYVGISDSGDVNGLIECIEVASTESRRRASEQKCKLKNAFTSSGYYLNGGFNKATNQTIVCDSSTGCETQNVDLGYYVNAGDSSKPIIKCEKEGAECTAEESKPCPKTELAVAGDYCYEDDQLKFYPATNTTAVSASKSDDYYTFASIPSGGFPGIKSETNALFKISRYFINRFYQSGVVMIDKNGKLVDNLSSDQSDISLYDCNDSTKTCTERAGCTPNTYMFDSENKKAIFCNSGKLEYAEFTGYVVDSNRLVGTNHPYIIKCDNNGSKCSSIKPKVTSYYENAGYDYTTNSLIECSSNNCAVVQAEVGYYVGHEGEGIIQCTSSSSCTYSKSKSKVKYVNSGSNKTSNAIISCSKNGCSAVKANIGYYLTYSSTLLIQCTSPSSCVEFTPTVNYYDNADSSESSNSIINCVQSSQVISCALEATNNGFYMSSTPNILIRCKSGSKCKTVTVKNGIFRGAIKGLLGGSKRSVEEATNEERDYDELEEDGTSVAMPRDSDDAYGIIRCVAGKCTALTASEIASIPVCEFNNNKCYITLEYAMTKSATTSITAGNICTNADRSVFYFATDTIVVKPNVISGVTATYVYTTTNSNCLEVNDSYTDMYFTVGSNIYLLDQGSVLQFYESGYYFINTSKNSLVSGNDIDAYNDENVKLYKCNGSSCSITDKPDAMTYYADINKRIIRYNINSDSYSFAYEKDITCIFANNKCTPNADLKNQEFCITYKGELALAKQDIKNRETGECYKASSITNSIYGYSQYLYSMNLNSAKMIDETGYYIVSLSTNTTVVSKNYKTKNNNLVIYGCQLSSCKIIEPDENIYYYDARAKNILRYKDGIWSSPATSGYAYISIDPTNTYIYRFTKNLDEIKINAMANYGYYYTVDGEMYHCDRNENGECSPIDNTGYYFTNAGEVYYCVHDSEELEPTECTKQACVSGQYYYIDEAYYRCESSSTLVPVMSRYCSYNENVIINFPLALTEEFPETIKQAIEGVEKNNNSTAVITRRGKNYLESVSGVFTNCTYNVEETKSTFDLVCVNNFVSIDENTDDVKICSVEQLGYVECIEDEENPEKCNVSGTLSRLSLSIVSVVVTTIISIFLLNRN